MKTLLKMMSVFILTVLICGTFFACNEDPKLPTAFYDGMNTSEIFDILSKSDSYSLDINKGSDVERYRFVLKQGYTISEIDNYLCKFIEESNVYTISYNSVDGYSVFVEPLKDKFFVEVQNVFDEYIQKLKDTFNEQNMSLQTELKVDVLSSKKVVLRQIFENNEYELNVYDAYIFDLDFSELFYLDSELDYKSMAKQK